MAGGYFDPQGNWIAEVTPPSNATQLQSEPVAATTPTNGQGLVFNGTSWVPTTLATGSGTVTTASVASANGFAGTVATATTTPAITISTSITGLLKGNGTAVSAATAGTDYLAPAGSGAALTGITQSQVSGSAPLASPTFTGTATIPTAAITVRTSTWQALPAPVTGTITIPWGSGDHWYGTLPNTSVTIAYSGVPSAGSSETLVIRTTQPASSAPCVITWPSGSVGTGGISAAVATPTNGAVDTFVVSLDPSGSGYQTTLAGGNYHS